MFQITEHNTHSALNSAAKYIIIDAFQLSLYEFFLMHGCIL